MKTNVTQALAECNVLSNYL